MPTEKINKAGKSIIWILWSENSNADASITQVCYRWGMLLL